ncbi:BON domain-containing protein [Undibacterium sp. Ren11W]|uniref:BON domain-containing protein n=1 Tax=Undibacterium sp. Ren11W TaxID=3413045 RepID=UPI003BF2A39E
MQNQKNLAAYVAALLLSVTATSAFSADPTVSAPLAVPSITEKEAVVLDDTLITAKVKSALVSDADVSAMTIHVTTKQGVVVLSGMVPNANAGDYLVKLVAGVEGVKSVQSKLQVKPG